MSQTRLYHFRCTLPEYYEAGCPGHTDLSARQGHYIQATTARQAAMLVYERSHTDYCGGCIHDHTSPHCECTVDVQVWDFGSRHHGKRIASVMLSFCPKCGDAEEDVRTRYSYGIYAGRLCRGCCGSFRDRCGLDGEQGSYTELEEMGETYLEEELI